jgi:hypothetical protein
VPHGDDYNPYRHGLGKFVRKFEYARALWPQPTAPKVGGNAAVEVHIL